MNKPIMSFIYVNYKGDVNVRSVRDPRIVFRPSAYHSEEDESVWMMEAYDIDKNDEREFLLTDILRVL